jgi:exosortase/archaeosortase family protein
MRGEVDKLKVLLALIIFFQGFSIALLSHPLLKASPWLRILGWLMMIGGAGYIYFIYQARKLERDREQRKKNAQEQRVYSKIGRQQIIKSKILQKPAKEKELEEPAEESLLTQLMNRIIKRTEKFSHYTLPIIGALIIDAVLIYNIVVTGSLDLKSWDLITLMFGASIIAYNYVPENFTFARDFFVFFLGLLFLILVFPPIFYELFLGSGGSAQVTKFLLADPVSWILNVGGIDSYTTISVDTAEGGKVAFVYFPLRANGEIAGVGIGEACSGIYTASIFLAAFVTFVLIEYKRFDMKVGIIIGLGILCTYIANILRMTIIILVGHYYDTVATGPGSLTHMNWTHINAGWLIFMAWIIPFWWLMYRYLMRRDISGDEEKNVSVDG